MKFDLEKIPVLRLLALIWVIISVVYSQTVFNGFVWDDVNLIQNNTEIGDWSTAPALFKGRSLFEQYGAAINSKHIYYKPFLGLWWMINYAVWGGPNAWGFHLAQLIFHLVNVSLVFYLVKALVNKFEGKKLQPFATTIAFWTALLWGIHPANSESVLYVAAGQEPLYLFFGLVSFLLLIHRQQVTAYFASKFSLENSASHKILIGLIGFLWLSSLLSKEAGIVFPFMILLYLALVEQNKVWKEWVKVVVASLFVYFFMRIGYAGVIVSNSPHDIPIHQASDYQRFLTVGYVLFQHLRVMIFPLDLFTGNSIVIKQITAVYLAQVAAVFGLLVVMIRFSLGHKLRLWLLACGLLTLGLVSNIIPLDMTHSERWVYLPVLLFIFFWLSLGYQYLGKKIQTLLIILVILFAGRVWLRVPNWKNLYTLNKHDSQYEVDSYHTQINYAVQLTERGEYQAAEEILFQALESNPDFAPVYVNIGYNYEKQDKWDEAEDYYRQSIEIGNAVGGWENLAIMLFNFEDEEFEAVVTEGLKSYPQNEKLRTLQSKHKAIILSKENEIE